MKIIHVICGAKNYLKEDHRSYTQVMQLRKESLKKKIQACTGFEPLTSAITAQRSTN